MQDALRLPGVQQGVPLGGNGLAGAGAGDAHLLAKNVNYAAFDCVAESYHQKKKWLLAGAKTRELQDPNATDDVAAEL